MKEIYTRELKTALALPAPAESLSYLTSILRSLLQSLSIAALEAVVQGTPSVDEDIDLKQFFDRFAQPSDGLPVEILDALIPRIRGMIFRGYMTGWFETINGENESLVKTLVSWVEFRNKRPAHGVLDAPTTFLWSKNTAELIQRVLSIASEALPSVLSNAIAARVGDVVTTISIPLVLGQNAIVIGKVASRKGVWKIHGQLLSWDDARDVTCDLNPSNIFAAEDKIVDKFKWREVPTSSSSFLILNNVPGRQTANFVGRTKELEKLKDWLGDVADSRTCLVFGDGGFGKTTLVLEFFNNLLEGGIEGDFKLPSVISFYTAKRTKWTEEGLVHFKGISDAMEDSVRELMYCFNAVLGRDWYKINGKGLIDKAVTAFSEEGFTRDDVLLIIDNTETLATSQVDAEELGSFISQVGKRIGRVVITSRRRELLAAEPVPVSQLQESEALQLLQKLGAEYNARSVIQAGERRLRQACLQLMYKPLLIDTLVRYIARSSSSLQEGLDQILRKTSDELLEFLYEDAWARMNTSVQEVFMVLVSLASPLDGKCVGDVCTQIGVQHAEFQSSLGETYFASIVDRGDTYDLEIVELATEFFRKKKRKVPGDELERLDKIAFKVDTQATERYKIERTYRLDRVADGFRSEYAKAAKIATIKKEYSNARELYDLAILEEPLNAALHERYASFLMRTLGKSNEALPYAIRATELDPNSADAWLTLGLVRYKLGDLSAGDIAMDKASKFGKANQLCFLRKAMARYHTAKQEPYSRRAIPLLKEADKLIILSEKSNVSTDLYYLKNKQEAEKYKYLIRLLTTQINSREALAANAPERT